MPNTSQQLINNAEQKPEVQQKRFNSVLDIDQQIFDKKLNDIDTNIINSSFGITSDKPQSILNIPSPIQIILPQNEQTIDSDSKVKPCLFTFVRR